ncbi:MAG TPA: chorismate synthase [Spirochaetota bacterium]|nr:chorismate synthase [Spirochaetota bacterium]HPS87208.1 chorismate synthase [Spirochaetota bacterium]
MNSFGNIFRVSIFGESHGPAIGITIDGCPPGIDFTESDMEPDIKRRMPGAAGTTPRKEADIPEILSGTYNGKTTGAPVTVIFKNSNTKSADYDKLRSMPRPGHADLTAMQKYKGFNDPRGGGHFSGRITLPLVAAGALAKKVLNGIVIESRMVEIAGKTDYPDTLDEVIAAGDSAGGIIEVRMSGVPAGLGEPFFNSFESCVSHIVFSVPAVKGIEFGSGFQSARMRGSEHNDLIISTDGKTATNNAGGINGGISNGNEVIFRVAVKPTPSIKREQHTVNLETGKTESLIIEGRHDACIALRAQVVFESCAAIAAADLYLINKSQS